MVSFQMPYLTSRRQKCNRLTHHTQRCDHKNTIFIAIDLNVWVKNKGAITFDIGILFLFIIEHMLKRQF